jgi:hypothetical protein
MLIRQTVFGFKIEKTSEELTALSKSKSDDFGARYDKASGLSAPKPAGLVFTCIKTAWTVFATASVMVIEWSSLQILH